MMLLACLSGLKNVKRKSVKAMSPRKATSATGDPSGPLNLLGSLLCSLPEIRPMFAVGGQ